MKWAKAIDNVIDVVSFDPDREWVGPVLGEDDEGNVIVVEPGHWGDVLSPPWFEVSDDVYGGFIWDGSAWVAPPVEVPTDWTIPADLPWLRMTDEEAELVQAGIDAAPIKTRNIINKATSFTTGTEAYTKFKAIITAALNATRADEILTYASADELSSSELETV